jgi:hypothetical protein
LSPRDIVAARDMYAHVGSMNGRQIGWTARDVAWPMAETDE